MVIVKLQGGLGNQMFQYACGRAIALRTAAELRLDLGFLLDRRPKPGFVFRDFELNRFKIAQVFASPDDIRRVGYGLLERVVARLRGRVARWKRRIFEPIFGPIVKEVFRSGSDVYLDGYWQSPVYFADFEDQIREDFTLWDPPGGEAEELRGRIEAVQSVCVNVRRGDFVDSRVMGTCDAEYYRQAEQYVAERVREPQYFVFSDDIAWCRGNLMMPPETFFVEYDTVGANMHWYQYLMKSCRHFIIPNSTFAWWAAYLCDSPDKIVVAPQRWFADKALNDLTHSLIPPEWIRI